MMSNQKGQVILILILVMTVALAIGLSVIQRSLSDVSTATKLEQSSRAFSAAEAGIEKAIQSGTGFTASIPLGNNASIQEVQASPIPTTGQAMEYSPLAKEELAQVWLADPTSSVFPSCDAGKNCYTQSSIDIYWGLSGITDDKPAIGITLVYFYGTQYQSEKFYFDSDAARTVGASSNGFIPATCAGSYTTDTNLGSGRPFLCKSTLDFTSLLAGSKLILLRARILYSNTSQSFAVQPLNASGGKCTVVACSLPIQAKMFTATGISGQTQRKVQVFRLDKVVPPYFDYAIFSAGPIDKN